MVANRLQFHLDAGTLRPNVASLIRTAQTALAEAAQLLERDLNDHEGGHENNTPEYSGGREPQRGDP